MNPKTKIKMAVDIAMTAILLLLMNLAWTGLVWHEVLGLSIVIFFTVHLVINRQWISSVARNFRTIKSRKTQLMFMLNLLLGLAMLTAVLTGVLISQYLFPGFTDTSFDTWYNIHAIASWLSLIIVVIHTGLHCRWIGSVIRRLAPAGSPRALASRLRIMAARATIGVIAALTVYSLSNGQLLDLLLPVGEETVSADPTSATIVSGDDSLTTTITLEPTPTPAETESVITLQQFLSSLTCTACRKHCLLSSPRCAKGVRQAESAETDYYEALENGSL